MTKPVANDVAVHAQPLEKPGRSIIRTIFLSRRAGGSHAFPNWSRIFSPFEATGCGQPLEIGGSRPLLLQRVLRTRTTPWPLERVQRNAFHSNCGRT